MVITAATNSDFLYSRLFSLPKLFFLVIRLSNTFDVFPLTQNEVSLVILLAAINLLMIAFYFTISEKQMFNSNFNKKLCFFRLEQQDQDEIGKVIWKKFA